MSASPSLSRRSFDELVYEGTTAPLEGWDFSFLRGRTETQPLPWEYHDIATGLVAQARRVLDVDTGGAEIFSSLRPPRGSVAVEPYHPNVPVAARRLEPLGVTVIERTTDLLPVDDSSCDLVLNRHGQPHPEETHRVLAPGGRLLTQQVGIRNDLEFNEALGIPAVIDPTLPAALTDLTDDLERAGLVIRAAREAFVVSRFLDVGAVIFQLRAVTWQAPGFNVEFYRNQLRRIHDHIAETGGFDVRNQRFLIQAEKPT